MVERNEIELKLQEANRRQLLQGKIDRREFISRSMVTGLGMAGAQQADGGLGAALRPIF